MASSNPPGSPCKITAQFIQAEVGKWKHAYKNKLKPVSPPLKVWPARAPAGNTTAARLLAYLPESIHLALTQELSAMFQAQVPASSTFPDAADGLGIYSIVYTHDAKKTLRRGPFPREQLQQEVRNTKARLDPKTKSVTEAQAQQPLYWLFGAAGLDDHAMEDKGLATMAACDAAMHVASLLSMNLKDLLNLHRPDGATWGADKVTPHIETPLHRSLPGGHALLTTTVCEVMLRLMGGQAAQARPTLDALALDLRDNRITVGVHTDLDNQEGQAIGAWLADRLADAEAHNPRWAALCDLARSEWTAPAGA